VAAKTRNLGVFSGLKKSQSIRKRPIGEAISIPSMLEAGKLWRRSWKLFYLNASAILSLEAKKMKMTNRRKWLKKSSSINPEELEEADSKVKKQNPEVRQLKHTAIRNIEMKS